MGFTYFWAERWDLIDLGKASEHDIEYAKEAQASNLVRELEYAGAAVEDLYLEMSSLSDLGKTRKKQRMQEHSGATWWNNKLRPRCLKCKAPADLVTLGEARKEHMEIRTARDTAGANRWKKAVEGNQMNWELTNIQEFRKFTDDGSVLPNEENAEESREEKPFSKKERKRLQRKYMLTALNNVPYIFAETADLMLAKFKDMNEAGKETKEWCETLHHIRRGELRDDVIEDREIKFREKANKWRAFKTRDDQNGMCKAADYHDTWFRTEVAAFNVYCICRAGGAAWPCRTVTLSRWWKTKHLDPLATKQK